MLILLKKTWTFFSSATDDDGNYTDPVYIVDIYEFDTDTRAVSYSQPYLSAPSQPPAYSRDPLEEFYVWVNGRTRTGYFHDGAGGFTTKVLTATLGSQGSNCFGASSVQLLAGVTTTDYTGPFTYVWNDATTGPVNGPKPAGTYTVTLTDTPTGAHVSATLTVGQNTQISILALLTFDGITLSATGGVGPYTYAWGDGPTGAVRGGLTANTYSVTVTDMLGCTATRDIVFETARFFFSRNPVVLDLQATSVNTKPNLRFLCEVWVEEVYLSGVFVNIAGVLTQPADALGRTVFDVSTLLDAYVQPDFPEHSEYGVHMAGKTFKRFYLQHSELWDGSPTPAYTQRDTYYLVYGGLDFFEYASQAYFTVYRPAVHPFLTWEPVQKDVFADQPEYLYYLHDSDVDDYFAFRVIFTDGLGRTSTVLLNSYFGTARYTIWRGGVGLPQLRAQLGGRVPADVVAWEVAVVNENNVPVSETRYFQLSEELPLNRRYYLFANSVGGVNTLACQGKAKTELNFANVLVQRTLQPTYRADEGESVTTSVSGVPTQYVNTGYLTPPQMDALRDCLLSEEVRYHDTDRYRPGSLQPLTSLPMADDDEGLLSVELAFVLPTLRRYTPTLPLRP